MKDFFYLGRESSTDSGVSQYVDRHDTGEDPATKVGRDRPIMNTQGVLSRVHGNGSFR